MRVAVPLALALGASGGAAAEGVEAFGEARLGFGYNIDNEGEVDLRERGVDARGVATRLGPSGEPRAVSEVRFGVVLAGETDGGLVFGAEILADEAEGGVDPEGQTEGVVFVSGAYGTLSFGDTEGADEQHVGEAVESLSLTGLGDFNETPYVSNGGGFGDDEVEFASDPEALPTVRYDYVVDGFGLSTSTNRDLSDVGLGASYVAAFEDGELSVAAGWYDFAAFTSEESERAPDGIAVDAGEQWSLGLQGSWGDFGGGVVYTLISAGGTGRLEAITLGATVGFEALEVAAFYARILDARDGEIRAFDGRDSYGVSSGYELGGGASLNAGVARSYGRGAIGAPDDTGFAPAVDAATVADFGVKFEF